MFEINKQYKIKRIYNGSGAKGAYAFIKIEDKKENSKFADKLTICVWGNNIEAKENDDIKILSLQSFGLKANKDQKGEWVKDLQCICKAEELQIIKNDMALDANPPQIKLEELDNEPLPF